MSRKDEFIAWLHEADGNARKLGIASPRFAGMLNDIDKGERDPIEVARQLIWSEEPKQGFLRAKKTDKRVSLEWGVACEFRDLFDESTREQARRRLKD